MITKWRNGEVMSSFSTSSTSSKSSKSNYHHGDLRQLLMGLALDHIASRGTEKLSLRALARDANVSPTAPFRHFPNKHALFAALATEGFQKLEARVKEVAQSSEPVERRLLATAVTYVGFAQENPVAYQLMFGAVLGDLSEFEGLDAAASNAYAELDALVIEVVKVKQLHFDELVLGGLVWSTIHGFASLRLNVAGKKEAKSSSTVLRPVQAIVAMADGLESNLKIVIDGLLSQSL